MYICVLKVSNNHQLGAEKKFLALFPILIVDKEPGDHTEKISFYQKKSS